MKILNPKLGMRNFSSPARADGWQAQLSGTRKEGSVDCIAGIS